MQHSRSSQVFDLASIGPKMAAFNALDYRRFDHLGSDSDEEPAEQTDNTAMLDMMRNFMPGQPGMPGAQNRSRAAQASFHTRQGTNRVKVHPRDDTAPAWVYTDPNTWEAPTDPCQQSD